MDPAMPNQQVAHEQRRANWLLEALSSLTVAGLLTVIWFGAQQSKQIDDTTADVAEIRMDIKEIVSTLNDLRAGSITIGVGLNTMQRDIERNSERIDHLERRAGIMSAPNWRNNGGDIP
jgi:hypothetical protein